MNSQSNFKTSSPLQRHGLYGSSKAIDQTHKADELPQQITYPHRVASNLQGRAGYSSNLNTVDPVHGVFIAPGLGWSEDYAARHAGNVRQEKQPLEIQTKCCCTIL